MKKLNILVLSMLFVSSSLFGAYTVTSGVDYRNQNPIYLPKMKAARPSRIQAYRPSRTQTLSTLSSPSVGQYSANPLIGMEPGIEIPSQTTNYNTNPSRLPLLNLTSDQVRSLKDNTYNVQLYCQPVTPPQGIAIGQVNNPDYAPVTSMIVKKPIAGGQSKLCTVYLVSQQQNALID